MVEAVPPIEFNQGVASGDVSSDSAVLWTRTNMESVIKLEVSTDPDFKKIDFKQNIRSQEINDFTVKTIVNGLEPDQVYYYKWRHGSASSEIGKFKTAPIQSSSSMIPPNRQPDVDFVWSGDSDPSKINGVPEFGNWKALDSARTEAGLDFFIYLGDTIYSDFRAGGKLPDAQTLDEYRSLYKDARAMDSLHNLLKSTSTYPIWDDHEVRDDWDGETVDPVFHEIGRKAFNEYMPIRESNLKIPNSECISQPQFRVSHWGKDVDLIFVDTRPCRSASVENICQNDIVPTLPASLRGAFGFPPQPPTGCLTAINDPSRTILGSTQKSLFKEALLESTAKFKFVITSVAIQQLYALPYDSWEGYGAERSEILNFIRANKIDNVIFLTTDLHQNRMNEVFIDRFANPSPVAYEVMTGPIGTVTFQNIILRALGPQGVAAYQALENILGVDCRHLDVFSYGSVNVNPASGITTISLKDENGNIIRDQLTPSISCSKQFEAEVTGSEMQVSSENLEKDKHHVLMLEDRMILGRQLEDKIPISIPMLKLNDIQ